MGNQYNAEEFEARARQGVVSIAQEFAQAAQKTALRAAGIVALTFAATGFTAYKYPLLTLPVSTLGSALAVHTTRKRQKEMRQNFSDIIGSVPEQASGIVRSELADFEKTLNTGKLKFSVDDLNPQKHMMKHGASLLTGLFVPALMPMQYLLMLTADEVIKLRQIDIKAKETANRNIPQP